MSEQISQWLAAAQAAEDARNHIEAGRLCQLVLEQDPTHVGALNLAAMAAAGEGDAGRAHALFSQAIEAHPGHSDSRKNIGTLLAAMGERELAAQAYRDALTLNGSNFDALNCLGILHLEDKQFDAAVDSFRRAIEIEPRNQNLYLNAVTAMNAAGRADDAIAILEQGVRLMPESGDLRVVLAHQKAGT